MLIATVQSIAQLRDIYGMNAAEAMSGLCNTRIFFRTPEQITAEWVSKSLGECEIDEPREGFSYGANTIRDGVSLNRQRVIRPVVMPSEIAQLPDLQAYLRLPGDWPVTKLKFNYQERKINEPAWKERQGENSVPEASVPTEAKASSSMSKDTQSMAQEYDRDRAI